MKRMFIMMGLMLSIVSCSVDREIISKEEVAKWSTKNDTIYYVDKAIALYDHSEYELNPGHGKSAKPIQELSIKQISFEITTDNLIKYIHTLHSKQKVEIVVPRRVN